MRSITIIRHSVTLLGFAMAISFSLTTTAHAQTKPSGLSFDFTRAVKAAGKPASAANLTVALPGSGDDPISLPSRDGEIGLSLPAKGPRVHETSTGAIFSTGSTDSHVAVETTSFGPRAMVRMDSASAPERYAFSFAGDVSQLDLHEDGSVDLIDHEGEFFGQIEPAWALDANGLEVPTHYEIDQNRLIQVINHRDGDFAYGIVADPSVWQVLKCAAALTVAAASTVFAVAKIAKIKKIIKAAGGVKKAARRVIKSFKTKGSLKKKAQAGFGDLGSAVVAAAVVVLDIDTIKSNCS